MIQLYCISKTFNGTTVVLVDRPCSIKKIVLFSSSKATFVDAADLVRASTAKAAIDAAAATAAATATATVQPVAELRGTVSSPIDALECNENEIINCAFGLTVIMSAPEAATSVRVYTMGNPKGAQGSL